MKPAEYLGFYNVGNSYLELEDFTNAKANFEKALKLKPRYEPVIGNLAVVYRRLGKIEKSLSCSTEAIKINPENANNYYNIAITFTEAERIDDAEQNYRKAILLDSRHTGSYNNLALIYQNRGQIEEGLNIIKKVLKFETSNADINHSIGIMNLQLGHLREGWQYNEYRWKTSPFNKIIWPFENKSVWKGEKGKRVVLWKEQGVGDDIIFLSLVPEIKSMCDTLSVYVDPRLQNLCRRAMPEIKFVKDIEEMQNIDCEYHLPMGRVPGLIRNDISDFDRTVKGYLKADPERVDTIRSELKLDGKTAIGISWKSLRSLNNVKKSIHLKDMEHIFSGLDIVLVNLQYGDVGDEIREFKDATGIDVVQCASVDNREDLDGLAALIEVCDLVVSTSNVTIHIAGALGKKTWVLVPYVVVNFWWLSDRTVSIWYPMLTVYRQKTPDDWDSVYIAIRKDLQNKIDENDVVSVHHPARSRRVTEASAAADAEAGMNPTL